MPVPLGAWRERALCAAMCRAGEAKDAWWHPGQGESTVARKAKAICKRCPVKVECLDHATLNGEKNGIWGGTAPEDRRTPLGTTKVRVIVCRRCGEQFTHQGYGNVMYCRDGCAKAQKQESSARAMAGWRERQRGAA